MPDALNQREKKTQWIERLRYVVFVKIGVAKKSSSNGMVIKQPSQQGKNWNERSRSALDPTLITAVSVRQHFPKRKCQRRDYGGLFAQDSQAKCKLAGPHTLFDIKPNSPECKCGCHEIGMSQRTLHKKDWVNSSGNRGRHRHASSYQPSCEQKNIRQGKGRQEKHRDARYSGLQSADGEPQCKVSCGKWRMPRIERRLGDERVRMREVVRSRNVEAGFIPKKGKPQEWRVQQKNNDKDQRVNALERELWQFVSFWRGQWLSFSREGG